MFCCVRSVIKSAYVTTTNFAQKIRSEEYNPTMKEICGLGGGQAVSILPYIYQKFHPEATSRQPKKKFYLGNLDLWQPVSHLVTHSQVSLLSTTPCKPVAAACCSLMRLHPCQPHQRLLLRPSGLRPMRSRSSITSLSTKLKPEME
jgi:hypothetical protein